ncbi:unnamed protein product [Gulo gulo]|uniref:Uncharacterized protein n=1 Tax=Gulo gulo TaxID=48420 RepID=A0A9X9PUZ8_GULGU|nr:unnamed protein product [Gulo gulo]
MEPHAWVERALHLASKVSHVNLGDARENVSQITVDRSLTLR